MAADVIGPISVLGFCSSHSEQLTVPDTYIQGVAKYP